MQFSRYNRGLLFIPEIVFQCPHIMVLNLEENYIREINDEIGLLTRLEELIIYDNLISEIPTALCETKLKRLDLSNNVIRTINLNMFNIITLLYLDFSHNEINELPEEISKLINLKLLDISSNDLISIPKTICDLPNLQFLDISNNNITELHNIAMLKQLKEFYCLYNKLNDFPIEIIELLQNDYERKVIIGLDKTSYNITNNFYYGKTMTLLFDAILDDFECPFITNLIILKSDNNIYVPVKFGFPCAISYY
jgi:Leucine-rich repeat (LRR) protein